MWLLSAVTIVAILRVLAHLNIVDILSVSTLSWRWILGGFALCAVWFSYADRSGLTSRKAMERHDQKKRDLINKQKSLLRTPPKR